MTMFTRLKRRPIEIILLLVTFNLVGTALIAVQALQGSPRILGFSIAAAIAACLAIVMIASQILDPLRRLVRHAQDPGNKSESIDHLSANRTDELGQLAGIVSGLQGEIARQKDEEKDSPLTRLEEAMRKLANGDVSNLLYASFPERFEGLRIQFNRLASSMGANIAPACGNAQSIKQQARSSQADLAVMAARLDASLGTVRKTSSALEALSKAARMRHGDASATTRHLAEAAERSAALTAAVGELTEAGQQTLECRDELDTLTRRLADLAVRAESAAAQGSGTSATAERALASECLALTREMMQVCRQNTLTLDKQQRLQGKLRNEAKFLAMDLSYALEPSGRVARNSDLELQRLSFVQSATREIEGVMARASAIAGATETAIIRMMSDASAIETRLSLFRIAVPEGPSRTPANGPNLRSVT
ncbi:HAMP domain-containing protein [Rhizobium helianthi]|uniref:HAMP domain-containing protein n=1 Tax=Rhizobium helianthi TaxID=1132695 RepID=A0ABW4M228_9HYPH